MITRLESDLQVLWLITDNIKGCKTFIDATAYMEAQFQKVSEEAYEAVRFVRNIAYEKQRMFELNKFQIEWIEGAK